VRKCTDNSACAPWEAVIGDMGTGKQPQADVALQMVRSRAAFPFEFVITLGGNGNWKICYFHHPRYSSATYHGPGTDLRKTLELLFVKYGVDVVFAGHDHVYERVLPQQGIYYFTEGASGSLRQGNLAFSALTAQGFDADRSFMMVEVAGDDLYFQAVSRTGAAVEPGVIHRTIRPAR
jgi:hypothetical protein